MGDEAARSRFSRRGFLARVGAGALAAGAGGVGRAQAAGVADPALGGFGRMFSLPSFAQPSARLEQALLEIGKPGGIMDAKDELLSGAALLFSPENSHYDEVPSQLAADKNNRNNPISSAGTTFFAQFIAHDITFDATSPLGRPSPVEKAMNARTVAFDLESVYLGGPTLAPQLYEGSTGKLVVESGGLYEDVPRSANGTPLVGDPRNDQTVILAGMHAAFLRFHNNALDRVGDFEQARRETRWHYQWLILHEFLPHVVGQKLVDDVLAKGRRFYKPGGRLFIPVEFQAAAFRFGHSMVRPSYRVNPSGDAGKPFIGMIFDPAEDPAAGDPVDLRGGVRSARRFVDWQTFFDFGDAQVRQSKRIDTTISTPLFQMPLGAIPGQTGTTSLAQRDLLRHVTWQLPSGQAIAKAMKAPVVSAVDLRDLKPFGLGLEKSTPLWFYILREAEVFEDGSRLGPVGGRIVAEVLIGILQLEATSFLNADPKWRPTFGGEKFGIVDFLTFAGVDPKSRALRAH